MKKWHVIFFPQIQIHHQILSRKCFYSMSKFVDPAEIRALIILPKCDFQMRAKTESVKFLGNWCPKYAKIFSEYSIVGI